MQQCTTTLSATLSTSNVDSTLCELKDKDEKKYEQTRHSYGERRFPPKNCVIIILVRDHCTRMATCLLTVFQVSTLDGGRHGLSSRCQTALVDTINHPMHFQMIAEGALGIGTQGESTPLRKKK